MHKVKPLLSVLLTIWWILIVVVTVGASFDAEKMEEPQEELGFVHNALGLTNKWNMFCPNVRLRCTKGYHADIVNIETGEEMTYTFRGRATIGGFERYMYDPISMYLLFLGSKKRSNLLYEDLARWVLRQVDPEFEKKKYVVKFVREVVAIPGPDTFISQQDVLLESGQSLVVREIEVGLK